LTENPERQPLGIKIIGVALIILGLNIIGQSMVYENLPSSYFVEESQRDLYNIIFKIGVGGVLSSILFISAIGLFFKKKYAHRLTEIITILIIISGVISLVSDSTGIIPIVAGIIIIAYFRQKNTKRYFWSIEDNKK